MRAPVRSWLIASLAAGVAAVGAHHLARALGLEGALAAIVGPAAGAFAVVIFLMVRKKVAEKVKRSIAR